MATVPESKADCERDAQCVAGALALLHKPVVLPPDVDFLSVPTLLRHEAFKFDKPSKWGMGVTTFETYPGDGIELFCANAKPDEEYILRCYYAPTNTSLHCSAVKDCKIADPFVGEWYDLRSDGFAQVGVTKILAGYRVVPKKRKPPKPAPITAKPASLDDLVSDLGALSVV